MQEITTVLQKGSVKLRVNDHLTVERAIALARDNGLSGRLEIQNILYDKADAVVYSLYFINEQNETVGRVYPYRHLWGNKK